MQQKPKRRRLWIVLSIVAGILVLSCVICGVIGATAPKTAATPTQAAILLATDTAVLPTDTPTDIPTLAPTATVTSIPTSTMPPTATPTPRSVATQPKPTPTPRPQPTPTHCVGVNNNPWCYDFNPGNLIYSPPSAFCSYFTCVSTFWTATRGYVAECVNGSYTHSAGVSGACSRDGGVMRALYSH